jgi:hypothetical protein
MSSHCLINTIEGTKAYAALGYTVQQSEVAVSGGGVIADGETSTTPRLLSQP